jgi:hypothetical protein
MAQEAAPEELRADPLLFGVGARVTVSIMSSDYVSIIITALKSVDSSDLLVQTGDVSTYIGGSESALLRYTTDLCSGVAKTGEHASISIHLSRGCPGEVACSLPGGAGPRSVQVSQGQVTGQYAAAEWALYPLVDSAKAGVEPDHMRDIYAAIDMAKENGTFRDSKHFVTRLEGDLGTVIATAFAGWTMVGRTVQHVASHLTVSINSPSHRK